MNNYLLSRTAVFKWIASVMIVLGLFSTTPVFGASHKPIVLKWTIHFPDGKTTAQKTLKWFAEEAERRTEGRIKSRFYWGSVLGKVPDFLKMVGGKGIADVGFIIPPFVPWEIPLWTSGSLPFLTEDVRTAAQAILKIYADWAPMQEEWKKVNCKPLGAFPSHAYFLWSKVPLKDLEGKRVTTPRYWIPIMKYYGASPVSMPAPQFYEALQRGVIHSTTMPLHTGMMFKFPEVVDYAYDLGFVGGQSIPTIAINLDIWQQIAPQDQEILEAIAIEATDQYLDGLEKEAMMLLKIYKQKGVKVLSIPVEEQNRLKKATDQTIQEDWIKVAKSKGVAIEAFMTRFKATIAEIKK